MDLNQHAIFKKYGIQVLEDVDTLQIKRHINFWKKSNIAVFLILILSLFVFCFCMASEDKDVLIYLLLSISLFFVGLSILTILKAATDQITITKDRIIIWNSLKKKSISIHPGLKLKLEQSLEEEKHRNNRVSKHWVYELFLIDEFQKNRILDFQSEQIDQLELDFIGNQMIKKISKRLEIKKD